MVNTLTSSVLDELTLQLAPEKLPTLPTVALQIIEYCRDETAPLSRMNDLIAKDPALSARVLRVANSPCYSRGSEVKTLSRALVLLGAKATSVMALSFSLKKSFDQSRSAAKDFPWDSFWRHAVISAVSCRALARSQRLWVAEEAFFCGLLGRIGQMALATAAAEAYQPALQRVVSGLPDSALERETLGISHHEVGVRLLRNWGLPDIYADAIDQWRTIETEGGSAELVAGGIVACGDEIARLLTDPENAACLQRAEQYAASCLALTPGELHRVIAALDTEVRDTEEVFQIAATGEYDFAKILDTARQQLVEVSLRTSVELDEAVGQVRELSERQGYLENAAYQDPLTGLPNRRALERELGEIIATGRGAPLAIAFVDVDKFKSINDTLGHKNGDVVLQHLGKFLNQALRRSDFISRYGGEEFVVVIPLASMDELVRISERIRKTVEHGVVDLGDRTVNITVSVGAARIDEVRQLHNVESLIEEADACLYEAKRSGRNCCVCRPFTPKS